MAIYFSAKNLAFYDPVLFGDVAGSAGLPADAVVVAQNDYDAVFAGMATGHTLTASAAGLPELVAPVAATLAQQAAAAYATGTSQLWAQYCVLNEPTPAEWVAYLKSVQAIADGVDTTSTALPGQPGAVATSGDVVTAAA